MYIKSHQHALDFIEELTQVTMDAMPEATNKERGLVAAGVMDRLGEDFNETFWFHWKNPRP